MQMAIKMDHLQTDLEHAPVKIITDVFLQSVNNALDFEIYKFCQLQNMTFDITE